MGLLDDAIREHFELKRRHGADPAETERAERAALAPVRRDTESLSPGFSARLVDGPGTGIYDQYADDGGHADPYAGEIGVTGQPVGGLDEDGEHLAPAQSAHGASGLRAEDFAGQDTIEYSVEDEYERDAHAEMLAQTPEFLQDAPDHDRLWFEQRRPREFDFDG
jgi:hypothetical protein